MPTKGTGPEQRLCDALRAAGLRDFERTPSDVAGRPDVYFRRIRSVAVFVDGCAWHGCPIHYRPHANEEHGLARTAVDRQKHRDRVVRAALAASGVRVLAFWEHDIDRGALRIAKQVAEALKA